MQSLRQINQNMNGKRPLFYWLVVVFNRVSEERIKEVGPDLACAEWLLRNGASVKWINTNNYFNNYDDVKKFEEKDKNQRKSLFIQGVDATDSGISHEGFPHFVGCKYISEMKLINCCYVGNEALSKLNYLKHSLIDLEISNCGNVTSNGLHSLKTLINLERLKLGNLPAVINIQDIIGELHKSLPKCEIIHENI